MATASININLERYTEQQPTDLRRCYACIDVIYSDMNVIKFAIFVGQKLTDDIEIATLCNPCYELVKDEL